MQRGCYIEPSTISTTAAAGHSRRRVGEARLASKRLFGYAFPIMQIALTTEQERLRRQLREYFAGLVTPEYQAEMAASEGGGPMYHQVLKQMGADGWLGIGWPKEYGGQGRTPIEQFLFFDEAMYAGVMVPTLTLNAVAPTLMQHANEEQKKTILPKILRGEMHFAIGYTEP
jgi:3-oxocholest-4-en-26-oyl-CoA dehydrogenase alpha subunit